MKLRSQLIRITLCLLCTVLATAHVYAITRYVSTTGNNTSPYTSWPTAARVIQDAVDVCSNGDRVLVAQGMYDEGGGVAPGGSLTSRVMVFKNISVIGFHGPDQTFIVGTPDPGSGERGDAAVRCVYLALGAELMGFTLSNGYTRTLGGSLDLNGGGVFVDHNGLVSNCVIRDSVARTGGGICCYYGGVVMNCTVVSNYGTVSAGGVYLTQGGLAHSCEIWGNRGANAGGVATWFKGTARNCLIYKNYASLNGGGAMLSYGGTLENCTLTMNTAYVGGGVYCQDGGTSINTIVYYNAAISNYPCHAENGGGMSYEYCCTYVSVGAAYDGGGNVTNVPRFSDRPNDDYRLKAGSSCIDTGTNLAWTTELGMTDLDGNERIYNFVVDRGPYEWVPEPGLLVIGCFSLVICWLRRDG